MIRRWLLALAAVFPSAQSIAQDSPSMTPAQMVPAMHMDDDAHFGMIRLDQFEHALDGSGFVWEGDAWYGGDIDKLWLRSEGEHDDGRTAARTELLWDRAFSPFWDGQLGVRADSGAGPARQWLALGVWGLAPYWFELEATGYVGSEGRTALRLRAEYELLITQRLILQPESEANLYGKSDPRRETGSGLSDLEFGLRLRYEIRRGFAPYVGLVWRQRFGATADFVRAAGHTAFDSELVAGLRIWF